MRAIPRIALGFGYAGMVLGVFFVAGGIFLSVFDPEIEILTIRKGYSLSDAFLYGFTLYLLGFLGSRIAKRELSEGTTHG